MDCDDALCAQIFFYKKGKREEKNMSQSQAPLPAIKRNDIKPT